MPNGKKQETKDKKKRDVLRKKGGGWAFRTDAVVSINQSKAKQSKSKPIKWNKEGKGVDSSKRERKWKGKKMFIMNQSDLYVLPE